MGAMDSCFWVGVDLDQKALFPWVWASYSRRVEDDLLRILPEARKSRYLGWGSRAVVLEEIKIPIPDDLEERVASKPLLERVQQAFSSFTIQKINAIASTAKQRGNR
jgi:hypothetical protein